MFNSGIEKYIKKLLPAYLKKQLLKNKSKKVLNFVFKMFYGYEAYPDIPGLINPLQGKLLHDLASQLPNGSTIVEIGTYGGLSTYFLGNGAKKSNSKVLTIDPYDSEIERQVKEWDKGIYLEKSGIDLKPTFEQVNETFRKYGLSDIVTQLVGFSRDENILEEVKMYLGPKPIGLLFIDGNHNYDDVSADIRTYSELMTQSGIICCDDARTNAPKWQGCVRAVNELIIGSDLWQYIGTVHTTVYAKKM